MLVNNKPPRRAARAGQALVEFALIGTLMTLVIMGTVDLARATRSYLALTNAAREGARADTDRQCTTTTNANSPHQRAIAGAPELTLTAANVTVAYTNSAGTTIASPATVPGDRTVVTVTSTFSSSLPIIGDIISGTGLTTMQASVTMAVSAVNPSCT